MELDRLLDLLAARHSFRARVRSEEPVQMWSDSGWISADAPVSGNDLHRMLSVAATPEVRPFVGQANTRYEFDFPHFSGVYRLHVEDVSGRLTVFILRLDQFAPPFAVTRDEDLEASNFDAVPTPAEPEPSSAERPRTAVVDPAEFIEAEPGLSGAHTDEQLHWFYDHAGQSMGPHTFEQMGALIAAGALSPDTMVFDSRVGEWQQARHSELERLYETEDSSSESNAPDDSSRLRRSPTKGRGRLLLGLGLGLVVLVGGGSGVAQMRQSNESYDYSMEFAERIVSESAAEPAGASHNVHLQRSFTLPSHYFGTAQYSDGYLADVQFDVQNRDFWARPKETEYHARPHDFAGELESQTMERVNTRLASLRAAFRADSVSLKRGLGNDYAGTIHCDNDATYPVALEIQEFDSQGNIARWDYQPAPGQSR